MDKENNVAGMKTASITVVIPCFNEERHICDCLEALENQTVKINQIIVVDNNCTDRTVAIANKFPGVIVLKEERHGRGYAQQKGFEAARGDYIARIDADTIVEPDWSKRALETFNEQQCDAMSGYGHSRTGIKWHFLDWMFAWSYYNWMRSYYGSEGLWGSNMLMTKAIWAKAKDYYYANDNSVHEDIDLALAISSVGGRIFEARDLVVSVDFKGVLSLKKYTDMLKMSVKVKKIDRKSPRFRLGTRINLAWYKRTYYHVLSMVCVTSFYLVIIFHKTYKSFRHFTDLALRANQAENIKAH